MKISRSTRRKLIAYLMIAPAALAMIVMLGYPMISSLVMSFFQESLAGYYTPKFIGLGNYIEIINEKRFLNALKVTIIYTLGAVTVESILGFLIALIVFKAKLWARITRTIFLIPMVFTPVVAGVLWRFLYHPGRGIINFLLTSIGMSDHSIPFLGILQTALPSIMLVDIWQATPFVMIVFMAGLSALPQEPIEAAIVDGASGLKMIWYVTLPLLAPIILVIFIIRCMDAFRAFDLVYVMTRGGPASATETLTMYNFYVAFAYFSTGKASAMAYIITFVVLLMSIGLIIAIKPKNKESFGS